MKPTNFQDNAQLFANAISMFLRTDEEYRGAWRYKHRQDALKLPRREALKNATAWAAIIAAHLEQQDKPGTLENYTGKMWQAWESLEKCRIEYFDKKTDQALKALKESEKALKTTIRSVNALLAQ